MGPERCSVTVCHLQTPESKEREVEHPGGLAGQGGQAPISQGSSWGAQRSPFCLAQMGGRAVCLSGSQCPEAMPGITDGSLLPAPAMPLQCSLPADWVVDPGGTGGLPF